MRRRASNGHRSRSSDLWLTAAATAAAAAIAVTQRSPDRDTCHRLEAIIFYYSVAIPARDELVRPLSWAISAAKETGVWATVRKEAQDRLTAPDACAASATTTSEKPATNSTRRRLKTAAAKARGAAAGSASALSAAEEEDSRLSLIGAAGPLIIAALTSTLALLVNFAERLLLLRKTTRRAFDAARKLGITAVKSTREASMGTLSLGVVAAGDESAAEVACTTHT